MIIPIICAKTNEQIIPKRVPFLTRSYPSAIWRRDFFAKTARPRIPGGQHVLKNYQDSIFWNSSMYF